MSHPDETRVFERIEQEYREGTNKTGHWPQCHPPKRGLWRFQVRRNGQPLVNCQNFEACTLHLEMLVGTTRSDQSDPYLTNFHPVKIRDRPRILGYTRNKGTFLLSVESNEHGVLKMEFDASKHRYNGLLFHGAACTADTIENVLTYFEVERL